MKSQNRRQQKRIKFEKSVKVPVYVSPVTPFIGSPLLSHSLNISSKGIALRVLGSSQDLKKFKKGTKITVHFRLPQWNIQECRGEISHYEQVDSEEIILGIRFLKISKKITSEINHMIEDNDGCDKRILEEKNPWCFPSCSFYKFCRKPIRAPEGEAEPEPMEIVLQKSA